MSTKVYCMCCYCQDSKVRKDKRLNGLWIMNQSEDMYGVVKRWFLSNRSMYVYISDGNPGHTFMPAQTHTMRIYELQLCRYFHSAHFLP